MQLARMGGQPKEREKTLSLGVLHHTNLRAKLQPLGFCTHVKQKSTCSSAALQAAALPKERMLYLQDFICRESQQRAAFCGL